jgi:hypothetical protein
MKLNDLINIDIDRCINSKKEYDYAILVYNFFKNKYIYKTNEWYILSEKNEIKDHKAENFFIDIKKEISNLFILRSEYWESCIKMEKDENIQSDYKIKSSLLIITAQKIQTNNIFIKNIIKESKIFFNIN